MSELPGLLSEAVGNARVLRTIELGGGDTVAVTTATTYLYRSEGLLKDESVEPFGHAVERLAVRTKRRKSTIRLETMDGESSFSVPSNVLDQVIEAMVTGILSTNGVVGDDEEIRALFRFSELTLVVTERRVLEHVGSAVWDGDFEAVEYADLTGLDFERGSVGTQVVLETADRRRRVKVPNEHAGTVRREIQEAVFGFHGVDSIEALRAETSEPDEGPDASGSEPASGERLASDGTTDGPTGEHDGGSVPSEWSLPADRDPSGSTTTTRPEETEPSADSSPRTTDGQPDGNGDASRDDELEALEARVDALSEQLDRQTELIESQGDLLEQLVDELRRGR